MKVIAKILNSDWRPDYTSKRNGQIDICNVTKL